MGKDFYLMLQVTRGATSQQIHSAYLRGAMEPLIELQDAYSVLSDPAQRAAYNRARGSVPIRRAETGRVRHRSAEVSREVQPTGSFREVSLSRSFDSFTPSFDEIFDRLWSNFDLLTRPKAERLESLTLDVPLSQQEALTGGSVRILVPARVACQKCQGRGAIGLYECWQCKGQGSLTAQYPLNVPYPAGLLRGCVVRVPLDDFGIHNFYLTVRFRPTEAD